MPTHGVGDTSHEQFEGGWPEEQENATQETKGDSDVSHPPWTVAPAPPGRPIEGLSAAPKKPNLTHADIRSKRNSVPRASAYTSNTKFLELERRGVPIVQGAELPGSPRHADGAKYLLTSGLRYEDLGYATTVRESHIRNPTLPDDLSQIHVIEKSQMIETTTRLLSESFSGTQAVVRLGALDGRPVALKAYRYPTQKETDHMVLTEIRSAMFYEQLGAGIVFHGLYVDQAGAQNIVMDVAPGDFCTAYLGNYNPRINAQTFIDLDTILRRIEGAGVRNLTLCDFQALISSEHRLAVIDPGYISEYIGKPYYGPTELGGNDFGEIRTRFISHANPEIGIQYLDTLRATDLDAWRGVVDFFKSGTYSPKDADPIYVRYHEVYKSHIDAHLT